MQRHDDVGGDTHDNNSRIPFVAPQSPRPTSSRERRPTSVRGRHARLSHRSRQGCWTCRARKVKCDEAHPRCGPCTRLNRDCDWDQRWNFSDATLATQGKHPNVNTNGNAVWDSNVRSSLPLSPTRSADEVDDDPDFYVLTTDEDREKKAEQRPPGTYALVLTPRSFLRSSIPEYAAARVDDGTSADMFVFRGFERELQPPLSSPPAHTAPNVVILDKFEDINLAPSSTWSIPESDRRESVSDATNASVKTEPLSEFNTAPSTPLLRSNDHLIHHFRGYIVPRLVQPLLSTVGPHQSSLADALEYEAHRFTPLYHAICAISALNLAYKGVSSLEEAMQHYHRALDAHTAASAPQNLLSDGVFFRHFLLLVYDICLATNTGADGEVAMWAEHLNQLRWLATQRHAIGASGDSYAYTIWKIYELDMYACLLGCGNGNFVQTMINERMLPAPELQIPMGTAVGLISIGPTPFALNEMASFPAILGLHQIITAHVAQIAVTAQRFRTESQENEVAPPAMVARWQATTVQLRAAMNDAWLQAYPQQHVGLLDASPILAANLPERVRLMFENAVLLYDAATIYTRTSMYPAQGLMPIANRPATTADTDLRATRILTLASLQATNPVHRNIVFPIFIAGVATSAESNKSAAIELIGRLENTGIGRNTHRTKQLLSAVCEEQKRLVAVGGFIEEVEWLNIARTNKLDVVNCGL